MRRFGPDPVGPVPVSKQTGLVLFREIVPFEDLIRTDVAGYQAFGLC